MSLFTRLLGKEGEIRAAKFLKKQGYRILERNYRTRNGEIDLIALHEGTVVFVEVKTRTNDAFGSPELAVNARKQGRMVKAALGYIKYKKLHQVPCRFDVVAINPSAGQPVELIRNAFRDGQNISDQNTRHQTFGNELIGIWKWFEICYLSFGFCILRRSQ